MSLPREFAGVIFKAVPGTLMVVVAAMAVGGFFGEHDWRLDLLSHFRVVYMIALMVFVALFALMRAPILTILAGMALLANVAPMLPYYWPQPGPPENRPALTLMQTNVWYRNPECAQVTTYIREVDPDIIAVEEYDNSCREAFEEAGISQKWPHYRSLDATWLALFSRYPITQVNNQYSRNGHGSALISRIQTPQGPLNVITVHTTRPKNRAYDRYQQEHLDDLAQIVREKDIPTVVIGDLNTTPWSETYDQFLALSSLQDSQMGIGIQPSWPSLSPLNLPMLPIDHVLVSPGIHVLDRWIGPDVGSDHRPVVVRISLPE